MIKNPESASSLFKMAANVVKNLMKRKDEVENEIKELHQVLETHGANMTDDLVDAEGYPRVDIDVLTVRKTRVRIIYLQNDLKHLMKQIEEGLYKVHAQEKEDKKESKKETTDSNAALKPFLEVDLVSKLSPAEKAGLEIGDFITKFGSVTLDNFTGLQMIGSVVQHSKGKEIELRIERKGQRREIKLTPNTWSGKGLLGCNVIPLKK